MDLGLVCCCRMNHTNWVLIWRVTVVVVTTLRIVHLQVPGRPQMIELVLVLTLFTEESANIFGCCNENGLIDFNVEATKVIHWHGSILPFQTPYRSSF